MEMRCKNVKIIKTDNLKTFSVTITVNDGSTEKDIKRAIEDGFCRNGVGAVFEIEKTIELFDAK